MTLPLLRSASEPARLAPRRARSLLAAFAATTLVPAVAAAVFSAVFWLVNLDTASGGYLSPLHRFLGRALPDGFRTLLVTLSHDASTVTPLVALMLSLAVARGSALVLFRPARLPRALASSRGHFPFASGYQTTWVQLGLIGTLWSFLLIGQELGAGLEDPSRSVLVLVRAFDTALLSTLSGIVGAFLLGPLLAGAFRARLVAAGIREESTASLVEELRTELTDLAGRVQETSRRFGAAAAAEGTEGAPGLTESALATSRALEELEGRIRELDVAGFAGRLVDELVERLTRAHHEALARLEAAAERQQTDTVRALAEGLQKLGEGIVGGQGELGRGLREGLSELAAARREEGEGDRQALDGRLGQLEGRLQAENRRLAQAMAERPLEGLREVELEGRQAVLRSLGEARAALDKRLQDLSTAVRALPRGSADASPGGGRWRRLRLPWGRS